LILMSTSSLMYWSCHLSMISPVHMWVSPHCGFPLLWGNPGHLYVPFILLLSTGHTVATVIFTMGTPLVNPFICSWGTVTWKEQ
jgi:hypothetical protein